MKPKPSLSGQASPGTGLAAMLLLLCGVLGLLFHRGFLPEQTLFSNDGPLGNLMAEGHRLPGGFRWQDLNGIGFREGGVMPDLTYGLLWLVGPLAFSKMYAPTGLLVLGLGAWSFFRQLGLAPAVCLLGGLAAVLNQAFFSAACWGLAAHSITIGMVFFALAALANRNPPGQWLRVMLAGLATGMAVTEGADIGLLLSLFIAAFTMYQGFHEPSPPRHNPDAVTADPPGEGVAPVASPPFASRFEVSCLWAFLAGSILAVGGGALLWLAETFLHLKAQPAHALADKLGGFILLVLVLFAMTLWLALVSGKTTARRLVRGTPRLAVVTAFAVLLASQAISGLVAVAIQGVHGLGEDAASKARRWDAATQWSLPKKEALGLIVPGLFGYRVDTPQGLPDWGQKRYRGGAYWGAIGSDAAWDRYYEAKARGEDPPQPEGAYRRFGGGAPYAGVLVVLLGFWAAAQALLRRDSVFSTDTRRALWFWMAVAAGSLLLAFGRFAPFYRLPYALLPYFSAIRNPIKFLHPLNIALVVLFTYGLHGLWRCCLDVNPIHAPGPTPPFKARGAPAPQTAGLKSCWRNVRSFDRRWTLSCLAALGLGVLAWMIYASDTEAVVNYIAQAGFNDPKNGQTAAKAMAAFSRGQVGWFLFFLAGAITLVTLVLGGWFKGRHATWAKLAFGLFLVVDLGLASQPLILTWHYTQKYTSDSLLDRLRQQPCEHRVAALPEWFCRGWVEPRLARLEDYIHHGIYGVEWAQHQFLYYNIQSLDYVQMPREPEDLFLFRTTIDARASAQTVPDLLRSAYLDGRKWQLTNTRYLLGAAGWLDFLNQHMDPGRHRFRMVEQFDLAPKPGVVGDPRDFSQLAAVPATNGLIALYEFTGALPRARLYSRWETCPTDGLWWVNRQRTKVALYNGTVIPDCTLEDETGRHWPTPDGSPARTPPRGTLNQLAAPEFDPAQTVLVKEPVPSPVSGATTNQVEGTVEFASYTPTNLKLKANASTPSVLLLNDHYDPHWHVLVDGRSAPLLRCNYLMRGVFLTPGAHTVEFCFLPPENLFKISLAAILLGVALCGMLLLLARQSPPNARPTLRAQAR